MIDRLVVLALAAMYAFFPLYGTFAQFAPHPPTAPLLSPVAAAAVAVVLGVAMLGVTVGAWRRRTRSPILRLFLAANVVATYAGALLGFDPLVGIGLATIVGGMAAAHAALLAYYEEPGAARLVYAALLGSGLAACLAALAFLALRRPADLFAYNHGRAVGTFLNPNELAEYLLAYLSAAGGAALVARGSRLGRFAAGCALVGAVTFALTFSRWGVVAAACGLIAFAVMAGRGRAVGWTAAALAGIALLNLGLAATHHQPQDTGVRDVAWRAGVTTWLHFPLTGVGPLAFERLYPAVRPPDAPGAQTPVAFDPHDLPLAILAETGIVGLAAFVRTIGSFLLRFPNLAARAPAEHRTLAAALFAGVVAVTVHMLLNSASIAFGLFIQFMGLAIAAARWGLPVRAR